MTDPAQHRNRPSPHWQSKLILLLFLPVTAAWITLEATSMLVLHEAVFWQAIAISTGFAGLVLALRAGTLLAAFTGWLVTATLYFRTPGWRTALWPLLLLFLLTFAATRFGRRRKERLGIAEDPHGRSASQVAANLGVAALATIPMAATRVPLIYPAISRAALLAALAALAEATADTLSSELGQVLGGDPWLLSTFRRVPAGTDGAVSLAGTLAGLAGAAAIALLSAYVLKLSRPEMLLILAAGSAGLFVDSLLGATLERRSWLNNDAVNALSTLAAAAIAALSYPHLPV